MGSYIVRRVLASLLILLAASFLMFALVTLSGDPLAEFTGSNAPDKERLIQERIQTLNLDEPFLVQYFLWLGGAIGCLVPGMGCDLGVNLSNQPVTSLIVDAFPTTLQLVLAATILAIVLGISIGIISAIRQYTAFDYSITFLAFLFYSLPIFWVAVLLKEFGAIRINDWLAEPAVTLPTAIVIGGFSALFFSAVVGGSRKQRLLVGAGAGVGGGDHLRRPGRLRLVRNPGMGPVVVTVGARADGGGRHAAVHEPGEPAGALHRPRDGGSRRDHRVRGASAARGPDLAHADRIGRWCTAIGVALAFVFGDIDRPPAIRAAVLTSFGVGLLVFMDRTVSSFAAYSAEVNGRPIATIGSKTPNFDGTFWETTLDTATHLVLPTLAIMLISFAGYSRYSRASMLEVLNADYVRTARAKGLTERTVVLRHAFRNAMIPLATLAAIDFGAVISGAIITETVFGWKGMGVLFTSAVHA